MHSTSIKRQPVTVATKLHTKTYRSLMVNFYVLLVPDLTQDSAGLPWASRIPKHCAHMRLPGVCLLTRTPRVGCRDLRISIMKHPVFFGVRVCMTPWNNQGAGVAMCTPPVPSSPTHPSTPLMLFFKSMQNSAAS